MECQTVEESKKLLCCHVDNTLFIFIIFDPSGFDSLIQYPNILIPSTITTTSQQISRLTCLVGT